LASPLEELKERKREGERGRNRGRKWEGWGGEIQTYRVQSVEIVNKTSCVIFKNKKTIHT
jgi:hypothetical protein